MPGKKPQLRDMTLGELLDKLGSAQPLPAAGSVAAITGATSAGLVAKIARVLSARPTLIARGAELGSIATHADEARLRLTTLAQMDMDAYQAFMAARRQPEQAAVLMEQATQLLEQMVHLCERVQQLSSDLQKLGSGAVLADLRAASIMAAGARGAVIQLIAQNTQPDVAPTDLQHPLRPREG
jgi:formiminotetrahydrofolate cyclodeaminase